MIDWLADKHRYLPLAVVSAWLLLCLAIGVGVPLLLAALGLR